MILYGLKTCDTCLKALKSLPDAEFVDVRQQGVPPGVMRAAIDRFGAALINKRSATWRGLDPQERQKLVAELLAGFPVLMKRPLIAQGDQLWLGWGEETRVALGIG